MTTTQDRIGPEWSCVSCARNYNTAENPPIFADGYAYCLRCLEDQLRPIADGHEDDGAPKLGDVPVIEIPGFLDRVDPDLRQRYQAGVALMMEAAPQHRIFCSNSVDGNTCNTRICKRVDVSGDGKHQWVLCTACAKNVCRACACAQTDANRDTQSCVKPQWLVEWEEQHSSQDRGVLFNFCPQCDRFITLRPETCNEMDCICECKFCMICGRRAAGKEHWKSGQTGCPRLYQPDDPKAVGDDPWQDASNIGGFDFPPLKAGHDLPWRRSAARVIELDRDMRQWRRRDVGSGTQNTNPSDAEVETVKELLLHARHLFTMMSNRANGPLFGLAHGFPHPHQINERLRFTHHAAHFRWLICTLYNNENEDLLPDDKEKMEGGVPWRAAFKNVRRLQLRNATLHDFREEEVRKGDLHALFLLLEARRDDLAEETSRINDVPGADQQRLEHLRIARNVTARCECLAEMMLRFRGNSVQFSASLSNYVHTQYMRLDCGMAEIDEIGEDEFRKLGPHFALACDVGNFFLNRFFEEQSNEWEQLLGATEDKWAFHRIWTGEMTRVLNEINVEQQFMPSADLREHTRQLHEDIGLLHGALAVIAPAADAPVNTVDIRLLDDLEDRYNGLVRGEQDYPYPRRPRGPLRPLLFDTLNRLESLLASQNFNLRARLPNAEEEPLLHAWRRARLLYRKVQYEHDNPSRPTRALEMLKLIKNLLFAVARGERFDYVTGLSGRELTPLYKTFLSEWEQCEHEEQHPQHPNLWYSTPQRQAEVHHYVDCMSTALNAAPWMNLALWGVLPPSRPDKRVEWRLLRHWYDDLVFVHNVNRRFTTNAQRQSEAGRGLQTVKDALVALLEESWGFDDQMRNDERTHAIRAALGGWVRDGELWDEVVPEREEQEKLKEVCAETEVMLQRKFAADRRDPYGNDAE